MMTLTDVRISKDKVPYLFLLPFFIIYTTFFIIPFLWAPLMSLQEFSFTGSHFVGLQNYAELLSPASQLATVTYNTLVIALIKIPIQVVLGLTAAILVDSALTKGKEWLRTTYIAPILLSMTVIGVLFKLLLADRGLVNQALLATIGTQIGWLTEPFMAKVSVALGAIYRESAISFLIFLAGLQSIDPDLYQAAKIDGANRLQQFRHVTLPQLRPISVLVIILTTANALKTFAIPLIMTRGGPGNASKTIVMLLYETGFSVLRMGEAAAIGTLLTIALAVIMIIQYRVGSEDVS